jgi:hypothetical protein
VKLDGYRKLADFALYVLAVVMVPAVSRTPEAADAVSDALLFGFMTFVCGNGAVHWVGRKGYAATAPASK